MQDWNELMNGKAFITDLGVGKSTVINGEEVNVGQYAVWSPVTNSTGHQVIEVSGDLEALNAQVFDPGRAGLPPCGECE